MMDVSLLPNVDSIEFGIGSSEKGNTLTTGKPRKKSMTSLYLKFFETALDGKSRRCKFCKQSYAMSTATGIIFLFYFSMINIYLFNLR